MTTKSILQKLDFFVERSRICLTTIMLSAFGMAEMSILTPAGNHIAAIGTLPGQLAWLRAQVCALVEGVRRATGDNRVIRQTPGLSDVAEPVYQRDRVALCTSR